MIITEHCRPGSRGGAPPFACMLRALYVVFSKWNRCETAVNGPVLLCIPAQEPPNSGIREAVALYIDVPLRK